MEYMFDHLHAVGTETLSFAPTFQGRAFLLRRRDGNLLIYSSGRLREEADTLLSQGGVMRQYLNHRHQAMTSCNWVSDRFGARLFVPKLEEPAIVAICHVGGTFEQREFHFLDFEVIPTPGHTEGSTCFLWDDGQRRYLFTGDTIYLKDEGWVAAVLSVSDRAAYLQSLALISQLDFDVIVPSMARGPAYQVTDRAEIRRRVAAIAERLERGEAA